MKKIRIGTSPLTGTIFAGTVLKDGMWAAGKQDVTDDALFAVALCCQHFGNPVEIVNSNGDGFRITAEPLK